MIRKILLGIIRNGTSNNKYRTFNDEMLLKGIILWKEEAVLQDSLTVKYMLNYFNIISICNIFVNTQMNICSLYIGVNIFSFIFNLIFSHYECCNLLSETKEINRTKQKYGNWIKMRIELWTKGRELDLCFLLYNDDIRFTGLLREDVVLIALDKMGHKSYQSLRSSIRINSLH